MTAHCIRGFFDLAKQGLQGGPLLFRMSRRLYFRFACNCHIPLHSRATAHLNASLVTNIPCEILVLRGLLIAVTYAPLALTFDRASIIGWDHVLAEKHLSERWSHSLANHHFCELRPELQYDIPTVLLFWISECSGFLKFRGAGTWEMQLIVFLFSVKSAALERFILHEHIPNIPADSMAKFIRGRNTRDGANFQTSSDRCYYLPESLD